MICVEIVDDMDAFYFENQNIIKTPKDDHIGEFITFPFSFNSKSKKHETK